MPRWTLTTKILSAVGVAVVLGVVVNALAVNQIIQGKSQTARIPTRYARLPHGRGRWLLRRF